MSTLDDYKNLCRDIVQEQADPDDFDIRYVSPLTDEQLAIVLRHFDHILPEVVGDHAELMIGLMAVPGDFMREQIRHLCGLRALATMKTDLECTADDMVSQAEIDREFEHA
jgi:hypothetical protein